MLRVDKAAIPIDIHEHRWAKEGLVSYDASDREVW